MRRRGFAAAASVYISQCQKASGTIAAATGELDFHSADDDTKYTFEGLTNVINNEIKKWENKKSKKKSKSMIK